MKKLVLLLIIGVLITASCSNDSEADLTADIVDNMKQMQDLVNRYGKGSYDMIWIVDKYWADTATFSTQMDPYYTVISHFPMNHFLSILYREKDPEVFHDEHFKYNHLSYWLMDLSYVGYSTSNAYLSNGTCTPRTYFKWDDVEYQSQMWINTTSLVGEQSALMYDVENDVWSGFVPLDSLSVTNMETLETRVWRNESHSSRMSFQTKGRKK